MVAFVTSFTGLALQPCLAHGSATSTARPAPAPARSNIRMEKSESIPFLEVQPNLNKKYPGYTGFDPVGLSNYLDQSYAEAGEVKNGRVAMLACLGMIVQDLVHLPGGPAFSESDPIKAITTVPVEGWIQIIVVISLIELATFKKTYESGATLGFDPLGMGGDSSMALKEIKNGRLAMVAAIGMIFQSVAFGGGPITQLKNIGSAYNF